MKILRASELASLYLCALGSEKTVFTEGVDKAMAPKTDDFEYLWLTYYNNTFNPARLKQKAMLSEMPKKYWKNLPESSLIPELNV